MFTLPKNVVCNNVEYHIDKLCFSRCAISQSLVFWFMWYIKRALATAFFQNYNQSRYFVKFALWCNTGLLIFWLILLFAVCNKKQFCLHHFFRARLYLTVAINSIRDLFLQFKDFIRIKLFCIYFLCFIVLFHSSSVGIGLSLPNLSFNPIKKENKFFM